MILIAGGTGLIGQALEHYFLSLGHEVSILSRRKLNGPQYIQWDPKTQWIDSDRYFRVIINLSGAGIVDRSWTPKYRKELLDSRVDSVRTLDKYMMRVGAPEVFINSNAIGYYGHHDSHVFAEQDAPATEDFLSEICVKWEEAVDQMITSIDHKYILRIGVVLAREGGAFPKMSMFRPFGVIPHFGNGRQYISWIHIADLLGIVQHLVEQRPSSGVYNAVAPSPVTSARLSKTIASTGLMGLSPSIPSFALDWILGKRKISLLNSTRVSADKIQKCGFEFIYTDIEEAVGSLI